MLRKNSPRIASIYGVHIINGSGGGVTAAIVDKGGGGFHNVRFCCRHYVRRRMDNRSLKVRRMVSATANA